MSVLRLAAVYGLTLLTFLLIDALWLGVIARDMYRSQIGHLLAANVRWGAALLFYVLYIAGLLVLVILPNVRMPLPRSAALGALLGFIAYATYDLTNLATLERWPLGVTLVDLAWGAFVTAATATAGWAYARWLVA
jgi:uncharacterized membrane protein